MWIADVVTLQTVSSVDHNNRRDRLVQTFDSMAEANAHVATLPDGALCAIAPSEAIYVRRGGAWHLLVPTLVKGSVHGAGFDVAATLGSATLTVPAGYAMCALTYTVLVSVQTVGPPSGDVEVKVYSSNGGVVAFTFNQTVLGGGWAQLTAAPTIAVNPNGDVITVTLRMVQTNLVGQAYSDDHNHQIRGVLYP